MSELTNMKDVVKEKYAEIAVKNTSCGCCGTNEKVVDYTMFQDDYSKFEGYVADADMGLGCGVPTEHAGIKEDDIVLDLGCGAGNDVFVARTKVGNSGIVIGVDMTQEMIDKANRNKEKLGLKNIEFKLGEIEQLPINKEVIDVVISNCVLNLVPDKKAAFGEMYAGCVSGALQESEYLGIIDEIGFKNIEIKSRKTIELPDELLKEYMTDQEIEEFRKSEFGIYSITLVAYK
jgi:SAM-dependent methyltransferase